MQLLPATSAMPAARSKPLLLAAENLQSCGSLDRSCGFSAPASLRTTEPATQVPIVLVVRRRHLSICPANNSCVPRDCPVLLDPVATLSKPAEGPARLEEIENLSASPQ